jgi:hypothetical protein
MTTLQQQQPLDPYPMPHTPPSASSGLDTFTLLVGFTVGVVVCLGWRSILRAIQRGSHRAMSDV